MPVNNENSQRQCSSAPYVTSLHFLIIWQRWTILQCLWTHVVTSTVPKTKTTAALPNPFLNLSTAHYARSSKVSCQIRWCVKHKFEN